MSSNQKHEFSQYIAEFIGTFFLVFFGCGTIILAQTQPDSVHGFSIPLVFGGTVSVMIYAVGHISGAHFNPAVTLAFWSVRKFPTFRIPGYLLSQFSGAIVASALHWVILGRGGHQFGVSGFELSLGAGLSLEVILSFCLMFVIVAVATDSRAVGELAGIAIGTTVSVCAYFGGPLTGASMNPARSLGPALLNGDLSQMWVYCLGPLLGTVLAAFIYQRIKCPSGRGGDHGCC